MHRTLPTWLRIAGILTAPLLGLLLFAGCNKKDAPQNTRKAEKVSVSPAVLWEIEDSQDFTGRIEAVERVEMRAMVSGYLDKRNFREGGEVQKGNLLFQIDPLVYQAKYDQAVANVEQASVRQQRLKKDHKRAVAAYQKGAMAQEEFDKITGDFKEADAAVKVAEANQKQAEVDLSYTKIYAPFSGRISRSMIDPGNLVKANDTVLTTLVSLDPVYAYFDIDERTLLRFRRLLEQGKIRSSRETEVPVYFALSDEDDFVHAGIIHWADNKLEPTTGTLRVRGLFANPNTKPADPGLQTRRLAMAAVPLGWLALPSSPGISLATFAFVPEKVSEVRILSPGLFVRVRLPLGVPYKGIAIPEEAVGSDQGQKFVFVVEKVDRADETTKKIEPRLEVTYRKVVVGPQIKVYFDETNPDQPVAYRKFKPGRQVRSFRVIEDLKYKLKKDGTHELKEDHKTKVVESGLLPGDTVVVKGLQRVRSGKEVEPFLLPVPAQSPLVETVVSAQ